MCDVESETFVQRELSWRNMVGLVLSCPSCLRSVSPYPSGKKWSSTTKEIYFLVSPEEAFGVCGFPLAPQPNPQIPVWLNFLSPIR